jgi:DNA-binding CsgD family transcriptional regulator
MKQVNVDHLIDDIYDAGACPELWPSTLSSIAAAAGAQGGVVFGFSKSRGLIFEYNGALDTQCATIFKLRHRDNVWVDGMARRPKNQLVVSDAIVKRRQLMQLEFYDEVLRPQRIAHGALATLTVGRDIEVQFSVQKSIHDGSFKTTEVQTLRRLIPHVQRALGVSLRLAPPANSSIMNALTDRFDCAAFTLDGRGELGEANSHASQLAFEGVLPLSNSGLRFSIPSEQRHFVEAFKEIQDGAPLRVRLMTEGSNQFELVCAALMPCKVHGINVTGKQPAGALVLVNRLSSVVGSSSVTHFAQSKGLTQAEWRVAKAAASGIAITELASSLGISMNTVKTHLRRIYQKLDVKRQSELVLLLHRASPSSH